MEKVIHHIRKIRRQPEEVRQSILHILTIVSGIVLVLLWVFSLGSNPSSENESTLTEDLKPFSALKDNLVGGFNSISGSTTPTDLNPDIQVDDSENINNQDIDLNF